jgi:hypothetical protein
MEALTFFQVINMIAISVGSLLLVIGLMAWIIGFEKPFDPGEFYQDKENPNSYHSVHFPSMHCTMEISRTRPNLAVFSLSLAHFLTNEDMAKLRKYIPRLNGYAFASEAPNLVALLKSSDIYWGDISHKIIWFLFQKLYVEHFKETEFEEKLQELEAM